MADVFLSYAREDRAVALALARALESQGWSVWWDREIHAGESFDRAIERELAAAGAVVVLWSGESVTSEWVRNEAADAAERGVLVPALLDDTKPPLEFRRRQAADLAGWRGDAEHDGLATLRRGIAAKLGSPASRPPATTLPTTSRGGPSWGVRSAVATVLVLLVLGAGLYRWRAPGGAASPSTTPAPGEPPGADRRSELADLVTGTYVGAVVSDAKGPSRSDVTVTVAKLGARRVRVSADYDRLRTVDVELTRIDDKVTSAGGPASLLLDSDSGRLDYSPDGEVSYLGTKHP